MQHTNIQPEHSTPPYPEAANPDRTVRNVVVAVTERPFPILLRNEELDISLDFLAIQ